MAKSNNQELEDDVQRLREDLRALREDFGTMADQQRERLGDACSARWREAEDTVREHPLAAVGIAAGVGLLAGLILGSGRGD